GAERGVNNERCTRGSQGGARKPGGESLQRAKRPPYAKSRQVRWFLPGCGELPAAVPAAAQPRASADQHERLNIKNLACLLHVRRQQESSTVCACGPWPNTRSPLVG